jgi:hypothetical protein
LTLVFGFELITILYKLQSIFLFVIGLKIASYLDSPTPESREDASAAAVAVLILTSIFGAIVAHYSKYCKMAYADQPNDDDVGSPVTIKKSTVFKTYMAYLVMSVVTSEAVVTKFLQNLEATRSAKASYNRSSSVQAER